MPTNRNALLRYQVIDRCLRNRGRLWTWEDILKEVNNALFNDNPSSKGIGKTTFYEDIKDIEYRVYSSEIERIKAGDNSKKTYLRYSDPDYSITNQPLSDNETSQLKSAISILSRFKGLPQFEWMDELIPVIENKLGLVGKGSNVIFFDNNIDYTGLQYITPVFHAIVNQRVLRITYHDFKFDKPYDIIFNPYIIKQYNNRWFSFGINLERPTQIWIIALDRIVEIKDSNSKYIPNETDWENDYFYDFVGVTKSGEELIEIKIELDQEQVPYVRTKPIHGSQKGPTLINNIWIISIRVIPNYELIKMLLSFGDSIRIISPDNFRCMMISILKNALTKYEHNNV